METDRNRFWQDAVAIRGSVTPRVLPAVGVFGLFATAVCTAAWAADQRFHARVGLEVAPYEIAGAALGLLLILRTNAGYDRWWEGRKLWGGIVNQSRNLLVGALAYGPADPEWRERIFRWAASFAHVARCSLRGEPPPPEVAALLGRADAARIASADHMPSFVALRIGALLREGAGAGLDRFAMLQIDRERSLLIDHIGACERILKTPLPLVYAIKIRRFIALFLLVLPFALLFRIETDWLIPLITMLVAYPLISLDRIAAELQNPFAKANLNHLPLDDITATIERNLTDLWKADREAG